MKGSLRTSAVLSSPSSVSTGLGASGKETPPRVISGILGGSVTFLLNVSKNAEIELITWTYLSKTLVLAITSRSDITILLKEYSGRLNISQDGFSLCMSNLTKSDSGSYQAQIIQKNVDHTVRNEFILHIYGEFQGAWGVFHPYTTTKLLLIPNNFVTGLPKPMSSSHEKYIYPIPLAPKALTHSNVNFNSKVLSNSGMNET